MVKRAEDVVVGKVCKSFQSRMELRSINKHTQSYRRSAEGTSPGLLHCRSHLLVPCWYVSWQAANIHNFQTGINAFLNNKVVVVSMHVNCDSYGLSYYS